MLLNSRYQFRQQLEYHMILAQKFLTGGERKTVFPYKKASNLLLKCLFVMSIHAPFATLCAINYIIANIYICD